MTWKPKHNGRLFYIIFFGAIAISLAAIYVAMYIKKDFETLPPTAATPATAVSLI